MFGRRRHVAPVVVPPAPAPQLTESQVFDIIHAQIAAAIGENGEWTLARRVEADSDALFHGVVAHAVATHVLDAVREARLELEQRYEASLEHAPEHVAHPPIALVEHEAPEPVAFGWEPAPITVWTDLKKPVTGPIAHIREHQLVA